jgi:hypothetical protein
MLVNEIFHSKMIKPSANSSIEQIRKDINWIIQKRENEFCEILDWNMNQITGFDFIQLLLKASNQSYNFSRLLSQIEDFLCMSVINNQSYFLLFEDTYFYLASLKILALQKGWTSFF